MVIKVITGYEIKKDKSGEVLVLHINYDEEFSSEFFRGKRKKITEVDFCADKTNCQKPCTIIKSHDKRR